MHTPTQVCLDEQAHKATLQRKIAERGAELAAKQQQRAAAEAERAALEARVAAQTFSKEDVQRMTAEKCARRTLRVGLPSCHAKPTVPVLWELDERRGAYCGIVHIWPSASHCCLTAAEP